MAEITESKIEMNDGLESVQIKFFLSRPDGESTLAERLKCRVYYTVLRSDGKPGRKEQYTVHVSDEVPGFGPGDSAALRSLLKKMYDAATAAI